jgi:uncharacterized membrane protein YjjB (DUF3815 family)
VLAAAVGAEPARAALAAVAALAPGMALTTAAGEVASGHWSSGSTRAAGALGTLAQLGAGLAIGAAMVPRPDPWLVAVAMPAAGPWIALALLPVALAVLGRTRPVDVPFAVLVAWAGTALARAVGGPAGAFVGALGAAALGERLGRWRRVPTVVLQSPALYLLVPGSIGVDALRRALGGDGDGGAGWTVVEVAGALAAGLLVGRALAGGRGARG